ncbi:MAG: protein kinase [Clostridia bacterium]|nr:protein kinase [Clostridia bacterium]
MDDSKKYIGAVFDGRYKIERVVGIGGMAFVYEATDLTHNRKVAIKLLKDKFSDDTRAVKRFINESKSLELLNHPNIVKIYDISVNTPHKYIVMEYINGITLRKYMNYKLPLEWREAVEFTEQILLALDHAHTKGVIHRDIKPQNIMIMQGGKIRVTDFGIAKIPKSESLTLVDKAIGTVYYISPEQASSRKIDARSDIYSLGVMLYEMVTGKLPFTADTPIAVIFKHINDGAVAPSKLNPAIPRGLEQIIVCAMEKNPQNRYQSAAQMLRHLRRLKLDPNTVFLQPKPAPRTPTSETVLKRTARAHRDTSEFDFVLNEGDRQQSHAQPRPQQMQKPQSTQASSAQQTQAQRVQQSPSSVQQTQAQRTQPQAQKPQPASVPRQNQQQRVQSTSASSARPQNMGDPYKYQNPSQRVSNRTIPLSQMYKPTSNQALMEEEYARRRQAQEALRRQSAQPQRTQSGAQATRTPSPQTNRSGAQNPQAGQAARPQSNRAKKAQKQQSSSSALLLIIMILLIALVCMLLLFVTLSNTDTAPILPEFMKTADKADTALLYLKQVIL